MTRIFFLPLHYSKTLKKKLLQPVYYSSTKPNYIIATAHYSVILKPVALQTFYYNQKTVIEYHVGYTPQLYSFFSTDNYIVLSVEMQMWFRNNVVTQL